MADNGLSLPVDIPWKRLCINEDMIEMMDRKVCDKEFPHRWRSSVAVFAYEPPEDSQTYEGMTISYLKVVCTITGLQLHGQELGMHHPNALPNYWGSGGWEDTTVIDNFKKLINEYYACYGAILEVSISPVGATDDTPLSQFPYFVDFQPKKRELFELVSQTGQALSRSVDEVNVQKGNTTTVGTEVLDTDKQFDWSGLLSKAGGIAGSAIGGPVGGGAGAAIGGALGGLVGSSGDKSPKEMNQSQITNLRTTDRSNERKESFSHTTQLTQMYHQFTAYHLGTNRAVFFMLPRPHIMQSEYVFVNGPRELEGMQEIFLVVMRPKAIKEFCVEAYLETAHLASIQENKEVYYSNELEALTVTRKPAPYVEYDHMYSLHNTDFRSHHAFEFKAPDRMEIDTSRGRGGFEIIDKQVIPDTITTPYKKMNGTEVQFDIDIEIASDRKTAQISAVAGLCGVWYLGGGELLLTYPNLEFTILFYLQREKATLDLFLTGRGVCCCPKRTIHSLKKDTITYEQMIDSGISSIYGISKNGSTGAKDANRLQNHIGRQMIQSINSPTRYSRGVVGLPESQFLARRVAKLIESPDHPDNQPVSQIKGLNNKIRRKIESLMPGLRRANVLSMQLQETKDRFGLNDDEALHLRRAALGLEGPIPDPKDRWDPPSQRIKHRVPNLVGLPLTDARRLLREEDLRSGETTYRDSDQPNDIVLRQSPAADEEVKGGRAVNMVLSTGLTVRIPDIVGKPLSEAVCMLHNAGLRSEPELKFVPRRKQTKHIVLDVTPNARTYVTPHSKVILRVSGG